LEEEVIRRFIERQVKYRQMSSFDGMEVEIASSEEEAPKFAYIKAHRWISASKPSRQS